MDLVQDIFQNPATYAILIIVYTIIAAAIIKFKIAVNSQKNTWLTFFELVCGSMSFFFFAGFGSQALAEALRGSIQVDYNLSSVVTVLFLLVYIVILWKTFNKIVYNDSWRWFGILVWSGVAGMIINAILTGGRYVPFIGIFLGGG